MNLGLFLAIGESFVDFKAKGQDELIKEYLLRNYGNHFDKVFVFSYTDEAFKLWENVQILPNKRHLHRYIYALLLPFLYHKEINSCDVIRGLQLTGGIPAVIVKLIWKKPIVINYGYDYVKFAKVEGKFLQARLLHLIKTPLLHFIDRIIITSKNLKKQIPDNFSSKIVLIPNGVDTNLFSHRFKKFSKQIRLIYFGRLEPQKNLRNLIEAVVLIKSPHVQLMLIGNGSEKDSLVTLAKKKRVPLEMVPPVNHSELPQLLGQADIFVLPSFIEGQPKALLEAMSCGLPVIASDIPAHREIIQNGENGILCSTEPELISKAIIQLISDTSLRKILGRHARITIEKKYNKQKLNTQEIKLLKIIASGQR